MEYRKATIADLDELARLRIDFMREVNGSSNPQDESKYETLLKSNVEYFRENITRNHFIAWIAEEDEKIVATSGLVFYNRPPSFKNLSGRVAYIMNIYTLEKYRKQGIASILLDKIIDEARKLGYEVISLNATDMGKSLYLKHGFKDVIGEMVLNINDN